MTTGQGTSTVRPGERLDAKEAALWRACKEAGSSDARQALFNLHYPFARQIAKRHFLDRHTGDIELADLYQLASAGLLEAIDKFQPDLGAPFRAYAKRRISGSVLDGIAKMSEVREQISFRNRVRSERIRSLSIEDADTLPADEALEALIDVAVGLALGFMLEGTGLYSADEAVMTPPAPIDNAYVSLAWKEAVARVNGELDALPPREQTVIRSHYLTGLNFDQIGALLGVTKGRVSQLHRAAIALLKKRLNKAGDFKLER